MRGVNPEAQVNLFGDGKNVLDGYVKHITLRARGKIPACLYRNRSDNYRRS